MLPIILPFSKENSVDSGGFGKKHLGTGTGPGKCSKCLWESSEHDCKKSSNICLLLTSFHKEIKWVFVYV